MLTHTIELLLASKQRLKWSARHRLRVIRALCDENGHAKRKTGENVHAKTSATRAGEHVRARTPAQTDPGMRKPKRARHRKNARAKANPGTRKPKRARHGPASMSVQERPRKNEPGHAKTETSTTRAGEHVRARTPAQKRTRARENERDTAGEHLRARTHTQNENGHANAKRARMCARKRHGLAKTSARARLRENEPEQAIENVHMPASEAGAGGSER